MKVSMKIKNRQGQQLAVQIQGVKNAPVIIFSNSLGTDHGMWQAQVDAWHNTIRSLLMILVGMVQVM